jgi:hypothetical protein
MGACETNSVHGCRPSRPAILRRSSPASRSFILGRDAGARDGPGTSGGLRALHLMAVLGTELTARAPLGREPRVKTAAAWCPTSG